MATKLSFTNQLRKCIDGCGSSRYRIGVSTGIDHATISRFMNGKGGLSGPNLDALAECIGMKAVLEKPVKKGIAKGGK